MVGVCVVHNLAILHNLAIREYFQSAYAISKVSMVAPKDAKHAFWEFCKEKYIENKGKSKVLTKKDVEAIQSHLKQKDKSQESPSISALNTRRLIAASWPA